MEISVIAPVYNEEENINRLIENVEKVLKQNFKSYEILLVNDGSTDKSKEILDNLNNENVKVIHFEKNCGQTADTAAVFKYSEGDINGFTKG